ncbi:7-carboxy-7-deazaguanine synthase [Limnobacter humi]|uniref:7-carboxy-7-deazaguanine synthase n=1 Tax=Limnobacter humi TaxID=1778671 RepID=A0ABT1WEB8_9BURK|nr:7-carboxy-7-deazaguanine synthase [Limnobacter humi]
MATYSVKELFFTLQGEGAQAGRAAVFCRFAGCNLWSGREEDRAAAVCQFCDTDFIGTDGAGGGKFKTAASLAMAISQTYQGARGGQKPYVVFTGGEPALQLDAALIDAVHAHGFEIAIETNGTLPVPVGVDWICVSPKFGSELVQTRGQELKVVVPQLGQNLDALARLDFDHFFVQAMDHADPVKKAANLQHAIGVCLKNPRWRLSVQTHKVIGMP